jgi:hypothetical protein
LNNWICAFFGVIVSVELSTIGLLIDSGCSAGHVPTFETFYLCLYAVIMNVNRWSLDHPGCLGHVRRRIRLAAPQPWQELVLQQRRWLVFLQQRPLIAAYQEVMAIYQHKSEIPRRLSSSKDLQKWTQRPGTQLIVLASVWRYEDKFDVDFKFGEKEMLLKFFTFEYNEFSIGNINPTLRHPFIVSLDE